MKIQNHRRLIKTVIVFGIVFLSGCAVTSELPVSMLESPETNGKDFHSIVLQLAAERSVTIVPDIFANPPKTGTQRFNRNIKHTIAGGIDLGLAHAFDVGVKKHLVGPWLLTGKLQLIGKNSAEALAGNFAFSLLLGLGGNSLDKEENDAFSSEKAVVEGSTGMASFGFSAGYRFVDALLVYVGPFISSLSYKGTIQQTNKNLKYDFKGFTSAKGVALGAIFHSDSDNNFELFAETSYTNSSTSTGDKLVRFDTSLGLKFDISKPEASAVDAGSAQ